MIDPTKAEKANDYLRDTADAFSALVEQARLKESMVKHVEALLVKAMDNGKVPVTLRKDYARAEQRYLDAITEDAKAKAELVKCEAKRDAAKTTISLYQSQVKDRM